MKIIILIVFSLIIHTTGAYAISRDKCELLNMMSEKTHGRPQIYKEKTYSFEDKRQLMRVYLRFYGKDVIIDKFALENAIQRDVEQCLKNKMMKPFADDSIKNDSIRFCALINSAYAFDELINKKRKLNIKNTKIQQILINLSDIIAMHFGEVPKTAIHFLKEIANDPKYGRLQYNANYILDVLKLKKTCDESIDGLSIELENYVIFPDFPHRKEFYKRDMPKIYDIMENFNKELQNVATFQLDPEKFRDFFGFMTMLTDYADDKKKEIDVLIKKVREIYEK